MKNLFLVILLAAAGYVGYTMWQKRQAMPAEPIAGTQESAPAQAKSPAITPLPAPQLHLAPEGTFFLLQRIAVTTDSGVGGLAPGTKVTLVQVGPPMLVTDGEHQVEVVPSQVTNDIDAAARASQADHAAQATIKSVRAQQAQQLQEHQKTPAAQSTPAPQGTPK